MTPGVEIFFNRRQEKHISWKTSRYEGQYIHRSPKQNLRARQKNNYFLEFYILPYIFLLRHQLAISAATGRVSRQVSSLKALCGKNIARPWLQYRLSERRVRVTKRPLGCHKVTRTLSRRDLVQGVSRVAHLPLSCQTFLRDCLLLRMAWGHLL
jgi:hypothetical protein